MKTTMRKLGLLAGIGCLWAAPVQAKIVSSYMVMGPGGDGVLRSLTEAPVCPLATIDTHRLRMTLRAAPRQYPPRPSASGAAQAQPSAFALSVCEAHVPRRARHVIVAGRSFRTLPAVVRRIVVIGDTGCRLKASSDAWQACNDGAQWPFARVAKAAAAARPDLVLHVGDYLYRENACPEGNAGCAGSPWGYGEAAWQADFLQPAAPLLAAAPWVMVRGNHEACNRAGQGWWRLLDPHPLRTEADCSDPTQDVAGDHTDPYPVNLGGGARLIVGDFAAIGEKPLTGAMLARYRADASTIRALAGVHTVNFLTTHYPFYALTRGKDGLQSGYASLTDAFGAVLPVMPHVTAMLAGHAHLLQYVARTGAPTQIVTGFSGTQEEAPEAPGDMASLHDLPGGQTISDIVSRFGQFGYGLLERHGMRRWRFTAYDLDGHVILARAIAVNGTNAR